VRIFIGLSLGLFMATSQASELTSCLNWYVTKGSGSQLNLATRLSQIDNSITFREPIDGPCNQFGDGYVQVSAQNSRVKEFQIIFYSAKLNVINFLSPTERLILNKQYQLANSATYYPVVIPRVGEHFTYSITKTGYGYQELIRYGTAEVRD